MPIMRNMNLISVLFWTYLLLNGSLLPEKSQLQSSFCLSRTPLVVLQISTGGLIESFIWSSSLCLANCGFALSLAHCLSRSNL